MQYTLTIDQVKSLEWGLNLHQAHIFSFIYNLSAWADHKIIGGDVYHRITKTHIKNKLPLVAGSPEAVKRHLKTLVEKGLIVRKVIDKTELWVKLTPLGKTWNTYSQGGEVIHKLNKNGTNNDRGWVKSDPGGGSNLTQGGGSNLTPNTNTNNTNKKNTKRKAPAKPLPPLPDSVDKELWDEFIAHRKRHKCPNTHIDIEPLIDKLNAVEKLGEGLANEVIMNSYSNGWRDLFIDKYLNEKQPDKGEPRKVGDRTLLTKEFIEANAAPGESWEAAKARLQAKADRENR